MEFPSIVARPSFENMPSWQQAIRLTKATCRLTDRFTKDKAGVSGTLSRLAAALPATIARAAEEDDSGFANAIASVRCSLREMLSYLSLAERLRCISRWRTIGFRIKIRRLDRHLQALHDDLIEDLEEQRSGDNPATCQVQRSSKPPVKLRRAA